MKLTNSIGSILQIIADHPRSAPKNNYNNSFYALSFSTINEQKVDFSIFKGKKVLLVNTASKCGFTPQFAGLEQLYQKYKDALMIVGFPSDNFASQEFHTNKEIQKFCTINYGVTFLMMKRSDVKGKHKNPVFQWLTDQSANGWNTQEPTWNFCKYLISEDGHLISYFPSKIKPMSRKITKQLDLK